MIKWLLLYLIPSLCFSATVSWNYEEPDFNTDGEVSVKSTTGQVRVVNNRGNSVYSSSTTPIVMNMKSASVAQHWDFNPRTYSAQKSTTGPRQSMVFPLEKNCLVRYIRIPYIKYRSNGKTDSFYTNGSVYLNGLSINLRRAGFDYDWGSTGEGRIYARNNHSTQTGFMDPWGLFEVYTGKGSPDTILIFKEPIVLKSLVLNAFNHSEQGIVYSVIVGCLNTYDK